MLPGTGLGCGNRIRPFPTNLFLPRISFSIVFFDVPDQNSRYSFPVTPSHFQLHVSRRPLAEQFSQTTNRRLKTIPCRMNFAIFLGLTYDELEDLNLKAKNTAVNASPIHKIQEERLKYLTDEKRIQSRDRALQRSRGRVSHARLRQEISDQELGQSHLDWLLDSRASPRSARASAPRHRTGPRSTGLPRTSFGSGKVMVFGEVIDKGGTPYTADIRGVLKGLREALNKKKGYTLTPRTRLKGSCS